MFLLGVAIALAVAVPLAGASQPGPEPLEVSSSSLTQDGQRLTWAVQLAQPFAPGALAPAGRSLCLLIERLRGAAVTARLCVAGPRPGGRSPRISYQPVTRKGPGVPRFIAATVTRAGSRELSASFAPASIAIGYSSTRWQVISTLTAPACTPPKPDGAGCVALFPRRPALAVLHVPRPAGCVSRGAPLVDNGPSDRKVIALTFDDGPWYDTPAFLNVLERYDVQATFFEIGDQVGEYGQGGAVERRMLADGDMIGDHTWNHHNVAAGGAFAAREISEAAAAIRKATHGFQPCLFRAPYGAVSPALISEARSMGFTTIGWDVDPRDWARPGVGAIYDNVVANAHPGAIIIQHDGGGDRSETLAALPREIQTLRRRGYRFVTITQLLGMRLLYR
jgi:peptidoglycan/xylan/chitin deacetylase (PgdA/CDA1 family)